MGVTLGGPTLLHGQVVTHQQCRGMCALMLSLCRATLNRVLT
jgi:hypothetical protein